MDYDPKNIEFIDINKISRAEWNPKSGSDYQKVKRSITVNGLLVPLFVRATGNGLELVDGHQRLSALEDLGYDKVPVYNLGEISETEAKQLALWLQVQVPFDNVLLAPLVVEIEKVGLELPYSDKEVAKFQELESFDMDFGEEDPVAEVPKMKTLKIRMEKERLDRIQKRIALVCEEENVSDGRAVELLVAEYLSGINL